MELSKLLAKSYEIPTLTPETDISGVDSLGVTEICMLTEEELGIQLKFDQVRKCATYSELTALIIQAGDK